ncbi:CPBP family intramembrane glutamic endopeptidase [Paucibacter sp. XJ19-41]|uniref:CPBP family intramembrane glutamic endopeptidase n=1 Tax=Paucibacter sp. XJ19-41 TaxID=2927824 RepID=UPI00234A93D5|nr:type II CAAX endopeptidase family protein [Paucibacter sp. XJ19-41]MDC6170641.1 type II CAAX endopeptidase family protein [Paucibacter sp. XJ19-41]
MKVAPAWPVALAVYLGYNAIIFATWATVGADYRNLVSADRVLSSVVLPMVLGALFLAAAVSRLGWWRPVLFEPTRARPLWALVIVAIAITGFVGTSALAIPWSSFAPQHLLLLALGTLLVGFNEETLTRGVLLTGLRGSTSSEVRACLLSTLLFGAMHLPNALFGMPLIGAPIQFLLASLMGFALYVLRRCSGSLLLPMAAHAAWDFISMCSQATQAQSELSPYFQFGAYGAAIIAVIAVLRYGRSDESGDTPPAPQHPRRA